MAPRGLGEVAGPPAVHLLLCLFTGGCLQNIVIPPATTVTSLWFCVCKILIKKRLLKRHINGFILIHVRSVKENMVKHKLCILSNIKCLVNLITFTALCCYSFYLNSWFGPCLKPCFCNIHVLVLVFQSFFDSIFSVWPLSKLFELNGSIHEWWFRWKLDRFVSQMCFSPVSPHFSSQSLH